MDSDANPNRLVVCDYKIQLTVICMKRVISLNKFTIIQCLLFAIVCNLSQQNHRTYLLRIVELA